LIQRIATKSKVDPALVYAVVRAESGFDRFAISHKGAEGLMQLMPGTARELGVTNSFIAEQNLQGGVTYLRRMLDLFAGNTRLALAAYNAGPETVIMHGAVPPFAETRRYVEQVLAFRDEIHASR
jgi:soluble lytic murein transglycosylase-like protein